MLAIVIVTSEDTPPSCNRLMSIALLYIMYLQRDLEMRNLEKIRSSLVCKTVANQKRTHIWKTQTNKIIKSQQKQLSLTLTLTRLDWVCNQDQEQVIS